MKEALLKTTAGRMILIGLAIRIVDFVLGLTIGQLPFALAIVDVVAGLMVVAGGAYFLARGLAFMNRRLLWRVRSKLIISYMFIGFIPMMLAVMFFLLGGVLLFFNFSAYMVRSEFRSFVERTRSIAHDVAVEVERSGRRDIAGAVRRQQQEAEKEFPGISIAVVAVDRHCGEPAAVPPSTPPTVPSASVQPIAVAGPWTHVDPPSEVPDWISCNGLGGIFLYSPGNEYAPEKPGTVGRLGVLIRAVGFPDSSDPNYAVVVDLTMNPAVRQELRNQIGVEIAQVSDVRGPEGPTKWSIHPLVGRQDAMTGGLPLESQAPPMPSIAYVEGHDWLGNTARVTLLVRLGIPEIYKRISAAPGLGTEPGAEDGATQGSGNTVIAILEFVAGLFLVIEVVALLAGLALAKSITGSVHELFEGTERVRQGDFSHKIAVKGNDQLAELAQSFNSMTSSIEDLLREAAEKKRLEEELRIAHEIQMSLLPQGDPRMPGVSLTAVCVPARQVGGDYYDFLRLDDHRLGLLIADVSGKGTSAALYMAELKGLMLSLSRIHTSPRELLIEADHIIAPHLDARSFITITYAIVDLQARTMTYARAGHTPLIYVPRERDHAPRVAHILAPNGLVLGLKIDRGEMFERLLEEQTIPLRSGDLFLFFTDGITEAMDVHDDFFGDQRLGRLMEEHADMRPEELRERMLREIAAFVGAAPQHDDMTMILLRIEDDELSSTGVVAGERREPAGIA